MNQDDYQKKIDEHRQSIGLEEDTTVSRRSRRSTPNKGKKKKSRNLLIPSLFFIFILIPVCIFIYVQFFFEPKVEPEVAAGIIQVETKTISNSTDKEEDVEEEESQEETPATTTPVTNEQTQPEEKPVQAETQEHPKEEPKEEPKTENTSKTHIVKANETLYRIAINYYNDPNAVEKIKAANGLSSNEISTGQKLILP